MILSCNNISKSFGASEILKDVSFHVNDREKAAIVGINGAGKTTLLKVIIGELTADEGNVILSKGSTIGYLSQQQDLRSEHTIYEEMYSVKQEIIDLNERIRRLELMMKHVAGKELEQMLHTYTRLTHEFEMQNGYAYKSEVIGILKGLGFTEEDFDKNVDTLSGGQKTRIALGKLLLSQPDILLLDEPTNHLDLISIAWLETFLINYKGAVIVVAHDRYFLDKVVTKIVELDHSKAQTFDGNYSDYVYKKSMQQNALLKAYSNQQREIKHQEEVITKLRSFNREKSIRRAESREKMLEKIERIEKPTENMQMHFSLEPRITSGNDVLSVDGLAKSYGSLRLFEDISFEIKRGEKVAIIGNNGTGKTTILKIITGSVAADSGSVHFGSKVHIGYYDQAMQMLNPNKTLFDELQDTYPHLDNTAIRNILAAFLFTEDDVFKLIKDISGGERGRVSLAKLMLSEANFLILDEPTNHLDISSKEILENVLNSYSGTILYVSHDRYFINKTATRILDLTDEHLLNYIGDYDYYLEKKDAVEAAYLNKGSDDKAIGNQAMPWSSSSTDTKNDEVKSSNKLSWQEHKEEQARLRKIKNDLKKTEDEIHELEIRDEEIDALLIQEEIFTDAHRLMELHSEKKQIEARLEELLEEWEKLAEHE
ncbi:MAG: ABC-F family ATP-binding cassette domain-containing protein [Clostridiales bacterium]|jgi:ATP-binding cassette subfamily F protein 3|nr:ABC-F family ATP-binding cassette domain-containing protein [Clostridiales bacterium]